MRMESRPTPQLYIYEHSLGIALFVTWVQRGSLPTHRARVVRMADNDR